MNIKVDPNLSLQSFLKVFLLVFLVCGCLRKDEIDIDKSVCELRPEFSKEFRSIMMWREMDGFFYEDTLGVMGSYIDSNSRLKPLKNFKGENPVKKHIEQDFEIMKNLIRKHNVTKVRRYENGIILYVANYNSKEHPFRTYLVGENPEEYLIKGDVETLKLSKYCTVQH